MTGRWFSVGTPVSFTNKANHQDITEILLKVALNTVKQTLNACNSSKFMFTARDVVNNLKENEINSSQDFSWISQLRYYFENEAILVKMITTCVDYAYEYLGNTGRLVITPLTDRCYR